MKNALLDHFYFILLCFNCLTSVNLFNTVVEYIIYFSVIDRIFPSFYELSLFAVIKLYLTLLLVNMLLILIK